MSGQIWQWLVKLTLVGNAVLFVLLLGASHDADPSVHEPIYPHKPVHYVWEKRQLTEFRYNWAHLVANNAWDVTGYNILIYQGGYLEGGPPYDVYLTDMEQGENPHEFLFVPHNGDPEWMTVPSTYDWATTWTATAAQTGSQTLKMIVLNSHANAIPVVADADLEQIVTHEFGHALGLGEHGNSYNGIMDGSCSEPYCTQDSPYDYIIWNIPNNPDVADEASCVRLLFNLSGKKLCD